MKRKISFWVGIGFVLCAGFVAGCMQKQETQEVQEMQKNEIIWYLSDPAFYGVDRDSMEPYQEVKSERFDLFNKRLEELGIPAIVVFKCMPREQETALSAKITACVSEEDPEADIVGFSPLEYDEFLILDEYLEKEENKKVLEALPEGIWKVNQINGNTYQIPRGNVPIEETEYLFYTPFLEKYQIVLNEEEIKQMTPKEVIAFLLPYFEEERLLDGQYYLTSSYDLNYMWYYQDRYHSVIVDLINDNLSVDLEQKKIVNLLDTPEFQEALEVDAWIYREDIDAHIEQEQMQMRNGRAIFRIANMPRIEELSGKQDSDWTRISLGNRYLAASKGNGVLKSSTEKELAVRVLAASMYDEELSNFMIYGNEGKDYRLEDGHAIYQTDEMVSSMGSFSQVGNNLIAYPNELEVKEKRQIGEQLMEETPVLPCSNFVPLFEETIFAKMQKVSDIYREIEGTVAYEEIPDVEAYLKEQRLKLEEAGVEEVLHALQEQLDDWRE